MPRPCKTTGGFPVFPTSGTPGTYTLAVAIPSVTRDTRIENETYTLFLISGGNDRAKVGLVVPYLARWPKGSVQVAGVIDPNTERPSRRAAVHRRVATATSSFTPRHNSLTVSTVLSPAAWTSMLPTATPTIFEVLPIPRLVLR